MRFFQVDVFASKPYTGNPLAVFPEAAELSGEQMQQIAAEMNLSESAFVTRYDKSSYDVRIFTPNTELPFAGHPTLGTAWVLADLDLVTASAVSQRTSAGDTAVRRGRDGNFLFERAGAVQPDVGADAARAIADHLGLEPSDVGVQVPAARAELTPAVADAGIPHLLIPVADESALRRAALPRPIAQLHDGGAYCYTFLNEDRVRARGFFPGMGITEDPATGSAAASLGLLLADRVGPVEFDIEQGVEMGRPSVIRVQASAGKVSVGGGVAPIFSGELKHLPEDNA